MAQFIIYVSDNLFQHKFSFIFRIFSFKSLNMSHGAPIFLDLDFGYSNLQIRFDRGYFENTIRHACKKEYIKKEVVPAQVLTSVGTLAPFAGEVTPGRS